MDLASNCLESAEMQTLESLNEKTKKIYVSGIIVSESLHKHAGNNKGRLTRIRYRKNLPGRFNSFDSIHPPLQCRII